jgi:hypothetical protein
VKRSNFLPDNWVVEHFDRPAWPAETLPGERSVTYIEEPQAPPRHQVQTHAHHLSV